MRSKPPKVAKGVRVDNAGFYGPLVEPGMYTVKLTKDGKVYNGTIQLIDDPVSQHSAADKALQRTTVKQLYKMSEDVAFFNQQVPIMKDSVTARMNQSANAGLKKSLQAYLDKLEKIRKELVATKGGQAITGEERIREKLSSLYGSVVGYEGRPSDSQIERVKSLQHEIDDQQKIAEALWKNDLTAINSSLKKLNLSELALLSRSEFDKADAGNSSTGAKNYFHQQWPMSFKLNLSSTSKEND